MSSTATAATGSSERWARATRTGCEVSRSTSAWTSSDDVSIPYAGRNTTDSSAVVDPQLRLDQDYYASPGTYAPSAGGRGLATGAGAGAGAWPSIRPAGRIAGPPARRP